MQVLRRLRRASLAVLRKEIEPTAQRRLAAFLPSWQGVDRHPRAGAGIDRVHERILSLKRAITEPLLAAGFEFLGPLDGPAASGITTFRHPSRDGAAIFRALEQQKIVASLRFDRAGLQYIRLSPHFYNTLDEVARVVEVIAGA